VLNVRLPSADAKSSRSAFGHIVPVGHAPMSVVYAAEGLAWCTKAKVKQRLIVNADPDA
jgi:hypothetical protein